MADGEEAGQSEAVDSGRPSSPAPKAQTKVEVKMTELEVIIQKEQLVSQRYIIIIIVLTSTSKHT